MNTSVGSKNAPTITPLPPSHTPTPLKKTKEKEKIKTLIKSEFTTLYIFPYNRKYYPPNYYSYHSSFLQPFPSTTKFTHPPHFLHFLNTYFYFFVYFSYFYFFFSITTTTTTTATTTLQLLLLLLLLCLMTITLCLFSTPFHYILNIFVLKLYTLPFIPNVAFTLRQFYFEIKM